MRLMKAGLIVLAVGVLAACENTGLRELERPGEGPDEFRILPGKPLEEPASYADLPPPTPGGTNITDQNPLQDGAAALGGRRPAEGAGPVPATDGAVVNYVSRFGRDGSIRQSLAVADEDFRRRRGRLTQFRVVRVDRYNQIYRREALDPQRELQRWRNAGARTPSAPLE